MCSNVDRQGGPRGISPKPGPEVASHTHTQQKMASNHPAAAVHNTPSNRNPSLKTQQNPQQNTRTVERSRTTVLPPLNLVPAQSGITQGTQQQSPQEPSSSNLPTAHTQNPQSHVQPVTADGTGSSESPPAPAWSPGNLRPSHSAATVRGWAHSTALDPHRHCMLRPAGGR